MTRGPDALALPVGLAGTRFRVATAIARGASPGRMRAQDLDARVHGVRGPRGASDELVGRCRLLQLRYPAPAFASGPTAALLMGVPLPWPLERDPRVEITVPAGRRAPHAAGVHGRSRAVATGDVIVRQGVRMSSPARVWCELSRSLELSDLVAAGDYLIHRRLPLVTLETLIARASATDRIGHSPLMRRALPLLDPRSESRPESHLRVIILQAGLPMPQINHELVATDGGGGMRTDFAFPELRLCLEYQGDYHRTKAQWRADMTRRMRLEALGWYVLELNADDLKDPVELASRIRTILARRTPTATTH